MKTEISAPPRIVPLPMQELLSALKVAPCPEGIAADVTYPSGYHHLAADHDQVLVAVVPYMLQSMLALLMAGTKRRITSDLRAAFFSCCMPSPGTTLGKFYAMENGIRWLLSWSDVDQLRDTLEPA
jgi:hypothetical protein